jgi:cytochrome c553
MLKPVLILSALACALPASPVQGQQLDATQMAAARTKAQVCFACHGPDGNSTVGEYPDPRRPKLALYLHRAQGFQGGRRSDEQMSPMAAQLSTEDMTLLGEFFAAQKQTPIKFQVDSAKVDAGRKTSDAVLCPMCHLGGFVGQNEIPRVAGQWPQYIKKQLADFKARRRTNDAGNMTSVAATLSDADIENLSQYIGNLTTGSHPEAGKARGR